jgi:hypothetical protein
MQPQAILYHLAHAEGLPEDTIRAARAQRDEVAPIFVDFVERYLSGEAGAGAIEEALFFVFHLLGEWRVQSAYRPFARLLVSPPDHLERVLGGAITETSHRVMAAVFDGDPRPLHHVIEAEHADEFARSRMLETLAMVTLQGGLNRREVATYLRDSFTTLRPHGQNFVWQGWQSAIALLGLEELSSLVKKAFDRGLIGQDVMEYEDFRGDLKYALAHPETPWQPTSVGEFTPFGDTIEELSGWYAFSPEYLERKNARRGFGPGEPASNPYREVGRNDPCPCGSGKKFKKCCLA